MGTNDTNTTRNLSKKMKGHRLSRGATLSPVLGPGALLCSQHSGKYLYKNTRCGPEKHTLRTVAVTMARGF